MSSIEPIPPRDVTPFVPGVPVVASAPTFDDYIKDSPLFIHLTSIDSFNFALKLSDIGTWPASATPNRLAYRLYDFLESILSDNGFYETESLETDSTERLVTIRYTDAEYPFSLSIDTNGLILLRRQGSTLERFHHWYWKIVPTVSQLVNVVTSFLSDEFKREAGYERTFRKQSAAYTFSFVTHDFRSKNDGDQAGAAILKNTEIVRRLLPLVPDERGALTKKISPSLSLGKTEYVAHRTVDPENHDFRREVYRVSAPGNWDWTSLWFTFSLVGDVYLAPDGSRHPFDENSLLGGEGLREAYVDFLRDRALNGFVQSIVKDYAFRSLIT